MTLPSDQAARKAIPMATGMLFFFPDALVKVTERTVMGAEQRGIPLEAVDGLRRDPTTSVEHLNCALRHMIDAGPEGCDDNRLEHLTALAWRALAALQVACAGRKIHDAYQSARNCAHHTV